MLLTHIPEGIILVVHVLCTCCRYEHTEIRVPLIARRLRELTGLHRRRHRTEAPFLV